MATFSHSVALADVQTLRQLNLVVVIELHLKRTLWPESQQFFFIIIMASQVSGSSIIALALLG